MKKRILFIILLALLLIPSFVYAKETKDETTNIYLFYGKECPHCEAETKYLNTLLGEDKYKNVNLQRIEVWHSSKNQEVFSKVQSILEVEARGVPYLIIGTNVFQGYSEALDEEIKTVLDFYLGKKYQDPAGDFINNKDTTKYKYLHYEKKEKEYDVPVLGKIDGKNVSLLLISIIIGAVDGFNPCAMWILLFLLSLLISTKDRKKMWILGLTFILTSGLIYLLFMMSWLNVAKYTSSIIFVRNIIGIFALAFGLINIYRYIKAKREKDVGCDVTDADDKRKIMGRIRNILSKNSLILAILGIIVLAASVNIIELLCSLGLPVMYTEILGLNDLSSVQYGLYMFIYILFFLIDDLIIFFIAMKTLKIKGISNKYMKYSHLIGGAIMLLIGILMLVKPAWLLFNF